MSSTSNQQGRDNRRKYLVKKEFQMTLSIILSVILILEFIFSAVIVHFMTSGNLTTDFSNFQLTVNRTNDYLLPILLSVNGLLCIIGLILVFFFVLKRTHRVAGPMVNLNNFLNRLRVDGDLSQQFKIRDKDQVQEIAVSLNKLLVDWRSRIGDMKTEVNRLDELDSTLEPESVVKVIDEIKQNFQQKLTFFKI